MGLYGFQAVENYAKQKDIPPYWGSLSKYVKWTDFKGPCYHKTNFLRILIVECLVYYGFNPKTHISEENLNLIPNVQV